MSEFISFISSLFEFSKNEVGLVYWKIIQIKPRFALKRPISTLLPYVVFTCDIHSKSFLLLLTEKGKVKQVWCKLLDKKS